MKESTKLHVGQYVLEIQAEPFRRGVRYHWMIYCAAKPEELVSWGHAGSPELAEAAARNEALDLVSGLTQGGRVVSISKVAFNRC
jgi:hypothetical protein